MIQHEEILNGKILIIDDNETNTMLLEQMLSQSGFNFIQSVTDSRKAMNTFLDFKPDLILLDLNMPYLNGFEVMEQFKKIEPDSHPPILILTANTNNDARIQALEGGALDFLNKPFNMVEGLARIKNMLRVRVFHNQINNQNQELDLKVKERTKKLEESQLEMIQRLSRAAEYRDNETGNHVIRMSRFSWILANSHGLEEKECDLILKASPMHDIGKIGIPDRILLKPGKLDADEWEIMKSHVEIGAKILSNSNSELLKTAEVIALAHHERWDGTGYPNGLKKDNIPLIGRIVTIADVFDALTSERPYKKAWTADQAFEELEDKAGVFFDPDLVNLFLEKKDEILEIKERYADDPEEVHEAYSYNPA